MDVTTACIAGKEIYRQWDQGRLAGKCLGCRQTPFGASGEIFLVENGPAAFYLLGRHCRGLGKTAPFKVNYRANLYAIKDLGVRYVLGWAPCGAITHNWQVGDLIILDDVIDQTVLRPRTFFEDSPLGYLRQFPVFCGTLRGAAAHVLEARDLPFHNAGTAVVCEGPRLETPAEIRMFAAMGAQLVTHCCVPEVFMAKELELCYAAIAYVVNYAETGSRSKPFAGGDLFGGITDRSESHRLSRTVGAVGEIVRDVAAAMSAMPAAQKLCQCDHTMDYNRKQYSLPTDWHEWFSVGAGGELGC